MTTITHPASVREGDGLPSTPYPLVDAELSARLERAEARANAGFVDARARLQPESGATWTDVGGTWAMFDGVGSPLTQTFGLGMSGPVGEDDFRRLEAFFAGRDAEVFHEVSPLADPGLLEQLNGRGYQPIEFTNILFRPARLPDGLAQTASGVHVRRIAEEADEWARVSAQGWSSEGAEIAEFIQSFGRVSARAAGTECFLAEVDGQPAAAGALILADGVALLAGASTVPAMRRRGLPHRVHPDQVAADIRVQGLTGRG